MEVATLLHPELGASWSMRTQPRPQSGSQCAALALQAQAGDREALAALLRTLAPRLRSSAARILGPGAAARGLDADDVLQEGLVELVRALGALREASKIESYALRIVTRRAIRARRRAKKLERAPMDATPLEDESASPEFDFEQRRKAEALLDLLDELPSAQAEALYLRVALGHTLAEVSQVMEVSPETVRSRVRLARKSIRKKLGKRPELCLLLYGARSPHPSKENGR